MPDPKILRFAAGIELQAAAGDKPRRLKILAYNGGLIRPYGFGDTVFDLRGMTASAPLPILDGHEDNLKSLIAQGEAVIGTSDIQIEASVLPGPAGDHALALLQAGAALQASVGLTGIVQRFIRPNEKATVNGQTFTAGPRGLAVLDRSELREVSVLPAGADSATSVTLAANAAGKGRSKISNESNTESTNLDAGGDLVLQEERARVAGIERAYQSASTLRSSRFGPQVETLRAQAVESEASANDFKASLLELHQLKKRLPPMIASPRPGTIAASLGRNHLTAHLLVRTGHGELAAKAFGADTAMQSERLAGSLIELCAAALRVDGRDEPANRQELIASAVSTGSMPIALGDAASKVMEAAYKLAPSTWRSWAAVRSASTFRTQQSIRPTFSATLKKLPPAGEVKHGNYGEESFNWSLGTYARSLWFDRQTIVNDDLSIITEVVPAMARAAMRSLSDLVCTVFLNNATFFTSGNANVAAGGGSALSATSLAVAIKGLRTQTDTEGATLDIAPFALVVPPELEATARALLSSVELARSGADQLPTGNPYLSLARLEVEPRLSNSAFTGNSATPWYLTGSPADVLLVVGFLDGVQTPTVRFFDFDSDPSRLAAGFRCHFDYGSGLGDYRAGFRSAGA